MAMKRFLRIAVRCALVFAAAVATPADDPPPQRIFAVQFTLGPAWGKETVPSNQVLFQGHTDNLTRLRQAGRVISGGLYGDKGIVLLRAADETGALAEFQADPAVAAKLFTITAAEFKSFYHGSTGFQDSPEIALLRRFLAALNRMDADALLATCTEDFAWLNVGPEQLATEVAGKEKLRAWLLDYFRKDQSVKTDFRTIEQVGSQVMVRERVSWDGPDGKRVSQQAFAVFEVKDGLIHRAWYFRYAPDAAPWTGQPFADPH
jgi:ketosteroid isomerase-like protein